MHEPSIPIKHSSLVFFVWRILIRHSLFFLYANIFPSQFEPLFGLPRDTLCVEYFCSRSKNSQLVFYREKTLGYAPIKKTAARFCIMGMFVTVLKCLTDFFTWAIIEARKAARSKLAVSLSLLRIYKLRQQEWWTLVLISRELKYKRHLMLSNFVVVSWPFCKGSSNIKQEYFFFYFSWRRTEG